MDDSDDELVLHVDGIPVLWGGPMPEKPEMFADVQRVLGDRVEWKPWHGEFPLTGDLLAESLHLCDDVVGPLVPARFRA